VSDPEYELNWESVSDSHGHQVYKARVPTGWIYRWDSPVNCFQNPQQQYQPEWITTTCFVPDMGGGA